MHSIAGFLFALMLLAAGCSSSASVDLEEPRRLLGRENDVRLDAQVFAERISQGSSVRIVWEVTNERPEPIAIADIVSIVTFEPEAATLTVHIGSEIPGNELLPRLVELAPGESYGQSIGARIPPVPEARGAFPIIPRQLRVKLSYLEKTEPFRELIGIQEKAVRDPQRADQLFEEWVEATATVTTNGLPIGWEGRDAADDNVSRRR